MSQWAIKAAERIKNEEATRSVEAQRFVVEDRLRQHHGPRLWMQLKTWLQKNCQEFNIELQKDVLLYEIHPQSEVVIRRLDKPRTLRAEFNSGAQRIFFDCNFTSGEYLFLVEQNGIVTMGTINEVPCTVEEVGAKLLDLLLR